MEPEQLLTHLDSHLDVTKIFLAGSHITMADFIGFWQVIENFSGLSAKEKLARTNLFRWVNHMQNLPYIKDMVMKAELFFEMPVEGEESKELSKSQLKKLQKESWLKDKKNPEKKAKEIDPQEIEARKAAKAAEKAAKAQKQAEAPQEEKKEQKQQKKQKQAAPKEEAKDGVPNISKIDLVVGRITKVWALEGSDKMYGEEVDIGNGITRTIASGLRKFVTQEQMQGALVCVLANLLPKKMLN